MLIKFISDGGKGISNSNEGLSESNDETPAGNGETPDGDGETPAGKGGTSEGEGGTPGGNGGIPEGEQPAVLFLLDRIDEELGVGIATPDQVLTAAHTIPCTATEPQPVYGPEVDRPREPYPPVCRGDGGKGVRIYIADTGLVENAAATCPWLHGVKGDTDSRTGPDNALQPYYGHGTFVAGVVRCLAPKAEIYVANLFNIAGSKLESDFVTELNAAFDFAFEVLHLTAECPTRKNIQLMALEAWLELLRPFKGVVVVAPAGNHDAGGRPGRATFLGWSLSGRSGSTGTAVRTSAITAAGSTCTRPVKTSSTPMPLVRIPATSTRIRGNRDRSSAWLSGVGRPSRPRSSPD